MKKLLSSAVAFALSVTLLSSAVFAADEPQAINDTPSAWATEEVTLGAVYGVDVDLSNWQGAASAKDFTAVLASFGITPIEPVTAPTRADVVSTLYAGFLAPVLGLTASEAYVNEAFDFFVETGLIKGRGAYYDFDYFGACTTQELVIFAKRVYEYFSYEVGKYSSGLFYKVSDADNTVYLLGSVHILNNAVYPMSKAVMAGFADSTVLVGEIDMSDTGEMLDLAARYMYYDGGDTIDKHISAEDYALYEEYMGTVGLTKETYDVIKPWAAAITIQSITASLAQGDAGLGADQLFFAIAGDRKVLELESAEFQYKLLDGLSESTQSWLLSSSLNGEESDSESVVGMVDAWVHGDAEAMDSLVSAEDTDGELSEAEAAAAKEYHIALFESRNGAMSEKVIKMLTDDAVNNYFVIAGAGHMVGETGIVKSLEKAGYTVTQIK
ncbi:hypothetical protein FACS189490_12960 [Clostridia bacterium]|nr:hypothetical protein FACS189490_12960 [Clostridia bacterium]